MDVEDFRVNVVERIVEAIREMSKDSEHSNMAVDIDARYRSLMASDLYFEDLMTDVFEYDDFSDYGLGRSVLNFAGRWFGLLFSWEDNAMLIRSFDDFEGVENFANVEP